MEINGINGGAGFPNISPLKGLNGSGGTKESSNPAGTGNFIGELMGKVNDLQNQADEKIKRMATGESRELHEVMLAVEKASISFQFLNQVRNKALEAYQEVMRMQV